MGSPVSSTHRSPSGSMWGLSQPPPTVLWAADTLGEAREPSQVCHGSLRRAGNRPRVGGPPQVSVESADSWSHSWSLEQGLPWPFFCRESNKSNYLARAKPFGMSACTSLPQDSKGGEEGIKRGRGLQRVGYPPDPAVSLPPHTSSPNANRG